MGKYYYYYQTRIYFFVNNQETKFILSFSFILNKLTRRTIYIYGFKDQLNIVAL